MAFSITDRLHRPQTNGAVEAANKNIKRILRKMVETSRIGQEAPFRIVGLSYIFSYLYWSYPVFFGVWYGGSATCLSEEDDPCIQKEGQPRKFQRGDLVLKVLRGLISDPRGKFRPSWSGPYVIRDLTREGAAWLTDLDGNQFTEPVNVDQLKKFYA
ncbi:hypothetical protein CK203_051098 [Vitis vinifera]|uniref:Integrase catalytic domain-containing protein n=1 Tax=Vitis vinifera TaxID=29760 RepID=A0A438FVT4_VITVI|nr:hypothetical protein CK203_051098 [Vitis vinifera]